MNGYRTRLSPEVIGDLYLAFEDDYEFVGAIPLPEEDLPCLRLANLPVALEVLYLVLRERREGYAADLVVTVIHALAF